MLAVLTGGGDIYFEVVFYVVCVKISGVRTSNHTCFKILPFSSQEILVRCNY